MILGVGIDLCDIDRAEKALEQGGFLRRFFTEGEAAYIKGRGKCASESLAGHFAAKEALLKAMGTGIVLPLTDIAVTHNACGAPGFILTGQAHEMLRRMGAARVHLSITHTDRTAAAVVVIEGG